MYKNGVEKFTVGNNLHLSVLNEITESDTHYVLVKISLFGKATYALCALGDGYAFEVIGESEEAAQGFFGLISEQAPSPCHLFDVVSDYRRERNF